MTKYLALASILAIVLTAGFGCNNDNSATTNLEKGSSDSKATGVTATKKTATGDAISDVQKTIEEVFGSVKLAGMMPNFPSPKSTAISYTIPRATTAADVEAVFNSITDRGYEMFEGATKEEIANISDGTGMVIVIGDKSALTFTFKIGEKKIDAWIMPADEAKALLKEN